MSTEKIKVVCDKDCSKCKFFIYEYGCRIGVVFKEPHTRIIKGDIIKIEIIRK